MKSFAKTIVILLLLAFVAAPMAQAGEAGDINPKKGQNRATEMPVERLN